MHIKTKNMKMTFSCILLVKSKTMGELHNVLAIRIMLKWFSVYHMRSAGRSLLV